MRTIWAVLTPIRLLPTYLLKVASHWNESNYFYNIHFSDITAKGSCIHDMEDSIVNCMLGVPFLFH